MKLGWSSLALVLVTLSGCTFSTSRVAPVGRSSTTGGVVCPSGYEPARNGSCVLMPNPSMDRDAFR